MNADQVFGGQICVRTRAPGWPKAHDRFLGGGSAGTAPKEGIAIGEKLFSSAKWWFATCVLGIAVLAWASPTKAESAFYDFTADPIAAGVVAFGGNNSKPWVATGGNPGGFLALTYPVSGLKSVIVFPNALPGKAVKGFTFACDVRVGNPTGDRAADGFSINFARVGDPILTDANSDQFAGNCCAETGTKTGLSVSFDTWAGNTFPNDPNDQTDIEGIIVRIDDVTVKKVSIPTRNGECDDSTSLQTGPRDATYWTSGGDPLAQGAWKTLCWQPLVVRMTDDAKLTVMWKGNTILDRLQTGYIPSDLRLVLAGRTGGANECTHLDNIVLTTDIINPEPEKPTISAPPTSLAVHAGEDVTFKVAATGTPPLNYQWRKNDSDLPNQNSATLKLARVTGSDTGIYRVVVSNPAGSATSEPAALEILPTITSQPATRTLNAGETVSFSVTADGSPPLTYQWRKDGVILEGATSATLTLYSVTTADSGGYSVVATNPHGFALSDTAQLRLRPQSPVFYDFSTDPLAAGDLVVGGNGINDAVYVPSGGNPGGFLALTYPSSNQFSSVVFPDIGQGNMMSGFHFRADVRIGNSSGDRPADGFSLSFARDVDPVLTDPADQNLFVEGKAEIGTRTGISVSFDTWSGNMLPDGPDIEGLIVRVDNVTILRQSFPTQHGSATDETSLQTGPRDAAFWAGGGDWHSPLSWATLAWVPLDIALEPGGKLTVKFKNKTILDGFQTTYLPGPGRFVLAGRTGGANEHVHFDNIILGTGPIVPDLEKPRLFALCIGQHEDKFGPDTIRGDKGAQAVFDRLSRSPSWAAPIAGNPSAPLLFAETFQTGVAADVLGRLEAMQIRDNDTFVFYFNGHGGPAAREEEPDGQEAPVMIDGRENTQDEFLSCSLSDDDLTAVFSQPKWRGVRKIFLIDSCHAGGFIGYAVSDVGDFEKLQNFALFASAAEDELAAAVPIIFSGGGMGIWTKELLLPALDSGPLSAEALQQNISAHVSEANQIYQGQACPLLVLNPPGSIIRFPSLSAIYRQSDTFDAARPLLPVPRPRVSVAYHGSRIALTFQTEAGFAYQLQESTDLVAWLPVGSPMIGTGSYIEFDAAVEPTSRVYRISVRQSQ